MTETVATETISTTDYFTAERYTGYGLIKETNRLLHDLGIDKVLPGPMGYTYLKKGYVVVGTKDIKDCTGDQGREWAERYVAKQLAKAPAVNEIQEALDALSDEA